MRGSKQLSGRFWPEAAGRLIYVRLAAVWRKRNARVSASMTRSIVRIRCFFICIAISTCFACGNQSGDDAIDDLYLGRAVPTAKLRVELDEPLAAEELYSAASSVARNAGFEIEAGGNSTESLSASLLSGQLFLWLESADETRMRSRSISIFLDETGSAEQHVQIWLLSEFSKMSFDEEDWIDFEHMRLTLIPDAFPNSKVVTRVHPAEHTSFDLLNDIEESTGISIPAETAQKIESRRVDREL